MNHLIAVGCSREQLDRPAYAKDLYVSERFRLARAIAERHATEAGTEWVILSGRHGVVSPDTVLEPYDFDLSSQPSEFHKDWSQAVVNRLEDRMLPNDQITFLARGPYAQLPLQRIRKQRRFFACAPLLRLPEREVVPYLRGVDDRGADLFVLRSLMMRYSREVLHMHQAKTDKTFGLVLGAGASMDIGFPSWDELVDRIARHQDVNAPAFLSRAPDASSRAQLLFHAYRAQRFNRGPVNDLEAFDQEVEAEWHRIIHACLYRGAASPEEFVARDAYLWAFLPTIAESPLTVNYNFDDSVELMLEELRAEAPLTNPVSYRTAWRPGALAGTKTSLIFHPNGYLPRSLKQRPGGLTFSEARYADQLIESMGVKYASFLHNLAHTTYLFLGVSLQDGTLRNLLRQGAQEYPGHFHYHIHFLEDGVAIPENETSTIRAARFDVLNIITLFLARDEIAALGFVLSWDSETLKQQMVTLDLPTVLKVFLTGVRAVGKTTALSHFHSIGTYEEWPMRRPDAMEKDVATLTAEERVLVDSWVDRQIIYKNLLISQSRPGIHLIDRAPLDAFAFIPADERRERAVRMERLVRGNAPRTLCDGHVIVLLGDERVLSIRCLARHVRIEEESLRQEQRLHRLVYESERRITDVTLIDTRDKTVEAVVKAIARVLFLEKNISAFSFDARLRAIAERGVD